jgi:hypothetical protein
MEKRLIVCGDSFNIGIGCRNLNTEPYGSLLAERTGRKLVNLAKGSSTNLSIWLQVKYAVEELHANDNDIVLVNETSSERFNWFPESATIEPGKQLTNLDVNYHEYPPYGNDSYWPHRLHEHPMQNHPNYTGTMITENVAGVIDYLDNFVARGWDQRGLYYNRIVDEPISKLKIIKDFYGSVYNESISQIQSQALMVMAYTRLHNAGIKHLMLLPHVEKYKDMVADENLQYLSWGELTMKYPDKVDTGHASEQGHVEAFEMILNKLQKNGWA